jgi:hypothetical protein
MTPMTPSFDEWVNSVHLPDDLGPDDSGDLAPGAMEFLREVYTRLDAVSSDELLAACHERQMDLARRGIELLLADVRRTTDLPNPKVKLRREDGMLIASYKGSYNAPALRSMTAPEAICEIAENLRDHIIEDLWAAWPLCPAHQVGLYAEPIDGRAEWYCRAGQHSVAPVGELRRQ